MAGNETPTQPEQPKEIPGFKGLENLDKVEALKKGAFREFLNKVTALRANPVEFKKTAEKLEKIDSDTALSPEQKKEQLRNLSKEELFAVIGKNIELGEKGMDVTLDFGKLVFAEQTAIGAGHILPATVSKVQFGEGVSATTAKRLPGTRGGEYRTENNRYMSSYTNTKIFIKYEDILSLDSAKIAEAETTEKSYNQQREVATVHTHDQQAALRTDMPVAQPAAATAPAESGDTPPSRTPIFIGDSQVEGLRGALSKSGILAVDFRGRRMEDIAAALKDPSLVNNWFGKNKKYRNGVKARLQKFHEQIKNSDSIIFQCGGNNVVQGQSLEKLQENFKKLVGTVRYFNRSARIFVGLLIPPTESSVHVETRMAYNAWLKEEAVKGSWKIVDSFGALQDPTTGLRDPKLSAADGLHLNSGGYAKMAKTALDTIKYQA